MQEAEKEEFKPKVSVLNGAGETGSPHPPAKAGQPALAEDVVVLPVLTVTRRRCCTATPSPAEPPWPGAGALSAARSLALSAP